ncbi:hypothetical protein Tsubulata_000543 [Turnera subulata]|uniref:DUF7795 domain-containing protein n=1 Tax=Turnera subulata TaxID=218843 RepID=A0A9Q0J9R3_9ROSI|nr:hypothetical protein Tsubulata_000543 [Turnera subulata]
MGSEEEAKLEVEFNGKVCQIVKDIMTRVAMLEELETTGGRFLTGYQQGLESLRRPPIDKSSKLIESIIEANQTRRLRSYIKAGCNNSPDTVQNMSNSKGILNELEHLLGGLTGVIETANQGLSHLETEESCDQFLEQETVDQEENTSSGLQRLEMINHAAMMGFVYDMVKQDYMMQERIINSLNLKSPSAELESYCVMWSLRPFVSDEVMSHAWTLLS